jgi:hypothetical protein
MVSIKLNLRKEKRAKKLKKKTRNARKSIDLIINMNSIELGTL